MANEIGVLIRPESVVRTGAPRKATVIAVGVPAGLAGALTALGNVMLMAVVFLALTTGPGLRVQRWLTARPGRLPVVTATALLIGGTFMIVYWGVRQPARFDYGWFPTMPWY